MIFSAVNICYDPSHHPFAAEGAVKIQNLNSERSAYKIVRAVLRDSDIDPEDAVSYSIHRCHCRFKIKIEEEDGEEAFSSGLTLDELEIRDGDSVFIRKIDDRVDENSDEMEEKQDSTLRRSSRKRTERADERADSTSGKRESTSNSSNAPAAVDKVSSNLGNLAPGAASAARSISTLLGGESWKSQSIGKLGSIQTRGDGQLLGLARLVRTSLKVPQLSKSESSGLFSSDVIEALIRAYHQRVGFLMAKSRQRYFFDLGLADYEQATEILKGKIRDDGSWERSSISHLDQSTLSKPASRFPLSDSGLSGYSLSTARAICHLWNNDKWINQVPLQGLSTISLKDGKRNAILREIAELTRVKPGEATPDGYPPIVLQAIRESIKKKDKAFKSNNGGARGGWSQTRCITDAFALLKERVGPSMESVSSSTATGSLKAGGSNEGSRRKRRKIAS